MHRLVLPLPSGFAQSLPRLGANCEYAVFDREAPTQANDAGVDMSDIPAVQQYLSELTQFLTAHRVVQYHPETYFTLKPSAERGHDDAAPLHYDGTPISDAELHTFDELLSAFSTFLPTDPAESMKALAKLVRMGPSAVTDGHPLATSKDARLLQEFYETTKSLMICRRRRDENDYPSLTFQPRPPIDAHAAPVAPATPPPAVGDDNAVFSLMVDHNMCKKKQHEVSVMRGCLRDLLACSTTDGMRSTTLMNVGEGKGYCSRVLALCDGVQVVGLDCNPDHKEGSTSRVEKIVEGQVGASGVNLSYRHRGHMASITCRVGPNMDWEGVLRGHVATELPDGTVVPLSNAISPEDIATRAAKAVPPPLDKIQCLVCGHILRTQATAAVLRHTKEHMKRPSVVELRSLFDDSLIALQPAAYQHMVETAPQAQLLAAILHACFSKSVTILPGGPVHCGDKRPREDTNAAPSVEPVLSAPQHQLALPRASRVDVWATIQLHEERRDAATADVANPDGTDAKLIATRRLVVIPATATVLGFDEGTRRHKVFLDASDVALFQTKPRRDQPGATAVVNPLNLTGQFMCYIIEKDWGDDVDCLQRAVEAYASDRSYSAFKEHETAASKRQPLAHPTSTGVLPYLFLRRRIPMLATIAPAVRVPSLSNVVMMGLHTCGDLGSSICRLFGESGAPGLLLVSCCWHALTNVGFPLSRAVQATSYTTESISLMLATQPLDMWAAEASEGHRGSAKLMFFRGILTPLWKQLALAFSEYKSVESPSCSCQFPSLPHLEPLFLRKMAKVKNTITLAEFASEVVREYVVHPTGWTLRQQQAQPGAGLCSACTQWADQIAMPGSHAHSAALQTAADQLEAECMQKDFKKFLGLTILRMWMSHLVETILLLDRTLYLHETSRQSCPGGSDVTLAPLFDGSLSPRMFGIFARRL